MTRCQGVLAGAILALSTVAGAAAYAQAPPNAGPQAHMDRGQGHEHRGSMIRRGGDGPNQAEHLRAILQLKPTQEPALTAYLEATRPTGDRDRMMRAGGEGRPKTTPEKLARMEARMNQHQAAMKTRIAATKRFYDQLDPAQRRAFDELPLMMGGPPMSRGGMKIMHHPRPPMPPMAPQTPPPPRS
jgi:LTXXQ motif family protein